MDFLHLSINNSVLSHKSVSYGLIPKKWCSIDDMINFIFFISRWFMGKWWPWLQGSFSQRRICPISSIRIWTWRLLNRMAQSYEHRICVHRSGLCIFFASGLRYMWKSVYYNKNTKLPQTKNNHCLVKAIKKYHFKKEK